VLIVPLMKVITIANATNAPSISYDPLSLIFIM
jgi:hypothetical protein